MVNLEAGTSSGGAPGVEYSVFLSFGGTDTPCGFTNCVYGIIINVGIPVFREEDKLHVGEVIDVALLQATDNSILYIPMLSRTDATSERCLHELAKTVENTDASGNPKGFKKKILLTFFDVEPDDVKARWRVLVEADEIKGWNLKKGEGQGQLIKLVVEEVFDKLKIKLKPVTEHLVGLTGQVEVMKLLDINSVDVRLIKIHGMGGIGKTTIAKVIFNQLRPHFGKSRIFLEDIKKKSTKDGLVKLQVKLLLDIITFGAIGRMTDVDYAMRMTREIT